MGDYVTQEQAQALKSRAERVKEQAKETAARVTEMAIGGLVGGAYGYINARQGGTLETPYSVAGKVPLDGGLAVALGLAALLTKESTSKAVIGGADAMIGIYAARKGDNYFRTASGAAATTTTAPAATSTSGYNPMAMRRLPPGPVRFVGYQPSAAGYGY